MTHLSRRSFARFMVGALNGLALLSIHHMSCECVEAPGRLASHPAHTSLRSSLDAIPVGFPLHGERWIRNTRKVQRPGGKTAKLRFPSPDDDPGFHL